MNEHTRSVVDSIVAMAAQRDDYLKRALKAEQERDELQGVVKQLLGALPHELIRGIWRVGDEGNPDAVITYTTEPSPETGHVGWVWWAKGKMGDAKTYAAAKAAAEAVAKG